MLIKLLHFLRKDAIFGRRFRSRIILIILDIIDLRHSN